MTRFYLKGLDPEPAALYLAVINPEDYSCWYPAVGMGFESHTLSMLLPKEDASPFFTHCQNCYYRKNYLKNEAEKISCIGGLPALKRSSADYNSIRPQTYHTYSGFRYRDYCKKQANQEMELYSTLKKVPQLVTFPDYALLNVSQVPDFSNDDYFLRAYVLNPNPSYEEDLIRGIPFRFGNVSYRADVCLGSQTLKSSGFNKLDFASVQYGWLNFERNYDWAPWVGEDGLKTLSDYADGLNKEGAAWVNRYLGNEEDVNSDWVDDFVEVTQQSATYKLICVPFNPEYASVTYNTSEDNHTFSFFDCNNDLIDTISLEDVEAKYNEGSDE